MKRAFFTLAGLAALVTAQPALACPPMLPGSVPPTEEQLLSRSLSKTTDIVYGIMVQSGRAAGEPSLFKVIHVYRGTAKKGDLLRAPPGWGHPTPYCAGMMGAPYAKPVGAYGVIAFNRKEPVIDFIEPRHVQLMIRKGWIKSARAG